MADIRIVDVSTILSKWHDLLSERWPNYPCQTFTGFIRNHSKELVRCKDCKRRGTSYECPFRHLTFTEDEGYHYVDVTTDDGYCSVGERKEVSHGVDGEKRADPSV